MFVCHPGYLDAYIMSVSSLLQPRVLEVEMTCSEETRKLFENEEDYNKAIKHIVLRNFSGYESYDYFSSNVHVVDEDNKVTQFSSINLSDYFNN